MVPYLTTMSVFDSSEMLFHAKGMNDIEVNRYLYDERRKQFPYCDIPIHYSKRIFSDKILYVNQLFNFDSPYLLIRSGMPQACFIYKTEHDAIVVQRNLETTNHNRKFVNSEEMYSFLKNLVACNNNEKSYAFDIDGRILKFVSKEERMEDLNKFFDYLEENDIRYKYDGYTTSYESLPDKSKIPNTMVPIDTPIFVVKVNGSDIKVNLVRATTMDKDYYRLNIYELPIDKFTLEQISCLANGNIKTLKEPNISKRLNKSILNI